MYARPVELDMLRKRIKRLYGMERINEDQLRLSLGLAAVLEQVMLESGYAATMAGNEQFSTRAIIEAGIHTQ